MSARIVWCFAVLVLAGGAALFNLRYETAVTAARLRGEALYRQTVFNRRLVRESAALQRMQAAVFDDLQRVSHETSLSDSTADLIAGLQRSGKRHRTDVVFIGPEQSAAPSASSSLMATALTIRARGRFGDLLAFIEDLSHERTLLRVSGTQLALAGNGVHSREPQLDATIHAVLYRLRMPAAGPEQRVAAAR